MLDKALAELDAKARTQELDEFQQKWIDDWRPMFVLHANAVRNMLQPNVGGYDKVAGTWYGYSANTKVGRWFCVNK